MHDFSIKKVSVFKYIIITLFILLAAWWIYVFSFLKNSNVEQNLLWAACYQSIALLGAISAFYVSNLWGGYKSLIGRSIIFFGLGLICQVIGQSVFSFYNLVAKVGVPYPSIADIGFFGSIICYVIALLNLAKTSGSTFSLKSVHGKFLAFAVPLILLVTSYFFFLKGYEFDFSNKIKIFLDFGYPLGDAVYLSLSLVTLALSAKFLGGIMKGPILIVLLALVFQYIADFNFLYQASNGSWINGGYGDFLYMCSYFVISLSLIKFGAAFKQIKES